MAIVDVVKDAKAFKDAMQAAYKGSAPNEASFNPYVQNGGTIAAIAGDNFFLIGGDTRLSVNEMVILSRETPKIFELAPNVYMGATGFHGDILQLVRVLRTQMKQYFFTYGRHMDVHAAAQMTSRTLYYKRFFPYYAAVILGGVDDKGAGALYSYDPVGTIELLPYSAQGEASYLMEPFLDNQVGWKNQPEDKRLPLTIDRAKNLLHDAFVGATEREKSTGDNLHVVCVAAGTSVKEYDCPLRRD